MLVEPATGSRDVNFNFSTTDDSTSVDQAGRQDVREQARRASDPPHELMPAIHRRSAASLVSEVFPHSRTYALSILKYGGAKVREMGPRDRSLVACGISLAKARTDRLHRAADTGDRGGEETGTDVSQRGFSHLAAGELRREGMMAGTK